MGLFSARVWCLPSALTLDHQCLLGWKWPVQTSSSQFSPVQCARQIDSIKASMALLCHFWFGLQQGRLCNSDLSGLKLYVNIANPCSKLLCTEVRGVSQIFRNQILIFRTWIVRSCNPVWMYKLIDIITSLCSVLIIWTKSHWNMIHVFGIIK